MSGVKTRQIRMGIHADRDIEGVHFAGYWGFCFVSGFVADLQAVSDSRLKVPVL